MPLKNFTRLELWNILISLYFFLSRTIFNTSHVVMRVTNGSNGDVVVRVKMKLPDSVPHIPGSGEMYVWYCLPCSGISARGTGKYVWVIDPAWGQGIGRVSFMRVYGRSCMRSIHSQKKNETNMKPSLPNKLRRRIKRTHSRSQQPCKFYETKQVLHRKRFEPPQDWFGTTTWMPFHCFGTPIWLPWRQGHTLHKGIFVWLSENSPPPPLSTVWNSAVVPGRWDSAIFPAWVANHSERSDSFCPLTELSIGWSFFWIVVTCTKRSWV